MATILESIPTILLLPVLPPAAQWQAFFPSTMNPIQIYLHTQIMSFSTRFPLAEAETDLKLEEVSLEGNPRKAPGSDGSGERGRMGQHMVCHCSVATGLHFSSQHFQESVAEQSQN